MVSCLKRYTPRRRCAATAPAAAASSACGAPTPRLPACLRLPSARCGGGGPPRLFQGFSCSAAKQGTRLQSCRRPTLDPPPTVQLRCRRFLALSRAKLYWMVPQWGASAEQVPVETQLLLLELEVRQRRPRQLPCPAVEPGLAGLRLLHRSNIFASVAASSGFRQSAGRRWLRPAGAPDRPRCLPHLAAPAAPPRPPRRQPAGACGERRRVGARQQLFG